MGSVDCRRCGFSLDEVIPVPWEQITPDSASILPREWPARLCPECRWPNLERSYQERQWSLPDSISAFSHEFSGLHKVQDSETAVAMLSAVRSEIVARLTQIVTDHPQEIAVLIFVMLNNLYDLEVESNFNDSGVKIIQQWLFTLLLVHGPLPIPNEDIVAATRNSPLWQSRDHDLMMQALIRINNVLNLASYGTSVSLSDGIVTTGELDDESLWVGEVNANIELNLSMPKGELQAQSDDPLIIEVERNTFGDSVADISALLGDIERLRGFTRVKTDEGGELITIDFDGASPLLQHLFWQFSLTPERLRTHSYPAFLFRGDVSNRTDTEIIESAAEMDWLTYAPLLSAVYYNNGEPRRARITSGFLAHRMSARAGSCLAFRLQRAIDTMRDRYPDLTPSVRDAVRKYHSYLEGTVSRIFKDSGMDAAQNLNDFAGRALPCGEIDVLAVGQGADGATVVCVTEVKDTDVSFYKGPGASLAAQTVRRGLEQADRKARWLVENMLFLQETFPTLASTSFARILPLVVTRHTPLPLSPGLPPVVSRYELNDIVSMLLESPPQSWRRDFRLSVKSVVADTD